jgi:hypothetical protein
MTNESPKTYATHKIPADYLDGEMKRSDLVEVLESMRFPPRGGTKPIELDAHVRDYLVGLLRRP